MKLDIIVASTREERVGPSIAAWALERAQGHGKFEVKIVDLKTVNLPLLDEPKHPRFRQYQNAHTKAWSAIVDAADAFVFVTPEYNYGMAPALLNALDYLSVEWAYKSGAIISYGGASGGMRSAQMTKQMLPSLRMVPILESVSIHFFRNFMDAEGRFVGDETQEKAATAMLDELFRVAEALTPLRRPPPKV